MRKRGRQLPLESPDDAYRRTLERRLQRLQGLLSDWPQLLLNTKGRRLLEVAIAATEADLAEVKTHG